jgi:ubiquinone/menaquinone biosynthesis C-methylase UbiE
MLNHDENHDDIQATGSVGNVVGNVYDKYHTRNPIARRLMRGFLDSVTTLTHSVRPSRVLEVGCGEGYLSDHLLRTVPSITQVEACDLSLDRVPTQLQSRISFRVGSVYDLQYADRSFDLVVCCEVLEHLTDPDAAMQELARVAKGFVLLSTPREPIWRILNVARGKYWSSLGNTPGHIQHFSSHGLLALARAHLTVSEIRQPIPWTMILGTPRCVPADPEQP